MGEQLSLPVVRIGRIPVTVRRRRVRRQTWRSLAACSSDALRVGFPLRALVEDHMLLAELRVRYRAAAKELRKHTGAPAAAFAATLPGRQLHRLMGALSERIEARESKILCG